MVKLKFKTPDLVMPITDLHSSIIKKFLVSFYTDTSGCVTPSDFTTCEIVHFCVRIAVTRGHCEPNRRSTKWCTVVL